MTQMNVYLPDDLAAQVKYHKRKLNVSLIFRAAMRQAIRELEDYASTSVVRCATLPVCKRQAS